MLGCGHWHPWLGASLATPGHWPPPGQVHILATMNPDGWLRAEEGSCGGMVGTSLAAPPQDQASGRTNERGVDLNRDFPGPGEGLEGRQPETAAVARWVARWPGGQVAR